MCEVDYRKQLGNCQKCGLVVEGRYQRSWQQWYRWKGFKCNYYSIMLIVFQNHESVWDALPSRLLYMLGMKSTTLPDYIAPAHPPPTHLKKEVLGMLSGVSKEHGWNSILSWRGQADILCWGAKKLISDLLTDGLAENERFSYFEQRVNIQKWICSGLPKEARSNVQRLWVSP